MAAMTAPSLASPCPATAVDAALDAMLGTVAVARALLEAGRRVDLAGLDREIGALCAAAIALPQREGRKLRAKAIVLQDALGDLTAALPQP